MSKRFMRGSLLTTTVFAGMAFGAPAWAQDVPVATQEQDDQANQEVGVQATADASPSDSELQGDSGEIVVTGSRIQRRDLTATSPLAVVNDEEFKLSGATNVEQVLNTLPQVVPGFTSASNNPGNGTATVDLRGLGAARTLVLVNGRRYIFSDVSQLVDLNTIPQFLVDSVDVVTGGASAVYGSDALAGVVNFRLRDDIEGIEAGGQVGITERGDGRRLNLFAAIGTRFADDRGYVTAFGEYTKRKPIFGFDRDFAASTLGDGDGELVPAGSSTPVQGRFISFGGANFNADPTGNVFEDAFFETLGVARPRTGADTYNYGAVNYLQIPQERYSIGGYGEFEVSPAATLFGEVQFVNNRVAQELAPTPVTGFFNIDLATQAQFLDAATLAELQALDAAETAANTADGLTDDPGVVQLFVQRRTAEVGPRNTLDERNAFRILGGVKGPVFGNFDYEAYYMYARTRNANVQNGNVSRSAFAAGLDGTGAIPINIFGPGSLTADQVGAISILAQNNDISELKVASASIAGTAGNLGLGGEDIGLAVGVEYRKVASEFIPDTALSSGDVIGFNAGQATEGSYDVKEIFGEVRLPIVADRPGLYRLELNAAGRYSDYSLDAVGGVKAYAAGIQYAPVRDITLRAQYQRAVRAPNVSELFGGLANGFPLAVDPCATAAAAVAGALRDTCIATGVPAATVGTPGLQLNEQIEGTFGGNPLLEEETSDTYTLGAVFRPSFIPGLSVTVDGYDIEIDDVISTFGGGVDSILNLCYNVIQDATSPYCQAVNRNPQGVISGDQFTVTALNANIAKLETRGVDLQVDYSRSLPFSLMGQGNSKVNFFFLGTYTDQYDVTTVVDLPDEVNECAGRFGTFCANPIPKYKWSSRLSLIDGPLTTSLRWRHVGKTRDDDDEVDYVVERLDAYNLFDLAFSLDATDRVSFSFGVNNIFDKKPQLIGDNQEQANTYPSTYDVLGRDYFVSANFRF